MQHLDEGTIHAWLDGAVDAEEARRIEAHLAECPSCAAAVAEARGVIAASSRILSALDVVPADVIPPAQPVAAAAATHAARPPNAAFASRRTGSRWLPRAARIAAVIGFAAVGVTVATRVIDERGTRLSTRAAHDVSAREMASAPASGSGVHAPPAPSADSVGRSAPIPAPRALGGSNARPRSSTATAKSGAAPSAPERIGSAEVLDFAQSAGASRSGARRDSGIGLEQRVGGHDAVAKKTEPASNAPRELAARDRAAAAGSPGAAAPRTESELSTVVATGAGHAAAGEDSLAAMDSDLSAARSSNADEVRRAKTSAVAQAAPATASTTLLSGAQLRLVTADRVVTPDSRVVQRRIYEVRPGVRITLEEAAALADHQAPIDGRARVRSSAPAASPMSRPQTQLAESDSAGLNSIQWTDSAGTQFTLTGRLTIEELRRLKPLVK